MHNNSKFVKYRNASGGNYENDKTSKKRDASDGLYPHHTAHVVRWVDHITYESRAKVKNLTL
jgi:hypothetical protein